MSWPDDNQPRFVVRVVHGFRIIPRSGTGTFTRKRIPVSAYVLDRAYAHRVVATFDMKRKAWPDGVIVAAGFYAAELNRRDQAAAA